MAGVVNLKLRTDFFQTFGNANQVMQNPIPKLRQCSIISEKTGYLSEKLKTLSSSNYYKAQYFSLKFCTRFLLNNV